MGMGRELYIAGKFNVRLKARLGLRLKFEIISHNTRQAGGAQVTENASLSEADLIWSEHRTETETDMRQAGRRNLP
jgi:hypothetical protein